MNWIPRPLPPDVITVTQRMSVEDASKLMKTMNQTPSAEAIALAVKLSGHTHCQCTTPCDGCLGDAATIDRELQLPQRNAALLLAQVLVDTARQRLVRPEYVHSAIDQLRDALARIKAYD